MKRTVAVLILVVSWIGLAQAQTPATPAAPAPASTAPAAPSPGQIEAAAKLLVVMHVGDLYDKMMDSVMTGQIQANPQLKPFEGIMREFIAKYASWQSVQADITQFYAQAFTQPELEQLTVFYQTPLGQKVVSKLPELADQSMALGQKRVQDHVDELKDAITKKMQEDQKAAGTAPKP